MLNLYAYSFVALMHQLRDVEEMLTGDVAHDPEAIWPRTILETPLSLALKIAGSLADELDMESTKREVSRIATLCQFNGLKSEIRSRVRELKIRIEEDLRTKNFLFVPTEMASFWNRDDAFKLGAKFQTAHDDIKEAGNCLALGRGTACVMHLARAMDGVLNKLASHLQVTPTPKATWGTILNAMSGKINKMPEDTASKKTNRDRWSEARVHLFHVKEAWRDRPLHAKESYTPARAKEIYEAVRVFMSHFASLRGV